MTPTLQLFTRALLTPDLSFKTLADARAATGADGLPRLMRTTRFAEAEITWRGRQWLLSMPLSPAALASVERTASQLGRLNTDHLAEYRILRDELRWTDPAGRERRFDLALQHLPAGKPFAEALHTEPAERLLAALDTLETALRMRSTNCGRRSAKSGSRTTTSAPKTCAGRADASSRCATTTRISALRETARPSKACANRSAGRPTRCASATRRPSTPRTAA